MNKTHSFLVLLLIMLLLTNMNCKKEDSCRNCNDTNKAPVAVAGSDQAISLPLDSVLLEGSSSRDPDGSITKWLWKKISGPSSFTISNEISAKTVVKYLAAGAYNFELKVTDNKGLSAMDTIQVTVNDPGQVNRPPVANAGPDQSITLPVNSVTLDGSASNDPDNNIASYTWSKISGPSSFTIINAVTLQTQVANLVQGIYQFELNVSDSGGLFAIDTIQVTVSDHGQPNQPPIANAGPDQSITLPAYSVNLDGSTSTDPDNNIASYAWSKISGPSSFYIINAVAVQTQVTNLVQGVYQFELTVKDNGGLSSKDTCIISVVDTSNTTTILLFENQTWIFPWYNAIEIGSFYTLVPQNVVYNIYIKRDTSTVWIEVPPISYSTTSGTFEYFIETRPDGGGIYNYGSLYIFYYGPDVSDTPDIKIEY